MNCFPGGGLARDAVGSRTATVPDQCCQEDTQTYARGVALFHQGQTLQEVLQVLVGVIKLTVSDAAGGHSIVGLALTGEWLGTAAVIAGHPTPVGAVTCCDTVVRCVPAQTFRRGLEENPQLSHQIHRAHARDWCRQVAWIGQLGSLRSIQRLRHILCGFAPAARTCAGSPALKLQLPIQHGELAELIGVTREHLSRLLRDLERDGLLRREKGWLVFPEPDRLCRDCVDERSLESFRADTM